MQKFLSVVLLSMVWGCGEAVTPTSFFIFWTAGEPAIEKPDGTFCSPGHRAEIDNGKGTVNVGCFDDEFNIIYSDFKTDIFLATNDATTIQNNLESINTSKLKRRYNTNAQRTDFTRLTIVLQTPGGKVLTSYPVREVDGAPTSLKTFMNKLGDLGFFAGSGWSK